MVIFTALGTARGSNGGYACELPERVTSAAAGARTGTRPDNGNGARGARNKVRQTKK